MDSNDGMNDHARNTAHDKKDPCTYFPFSLAMMMMET